MREEHLFNKSLLHATRMALVLIISAVQRAHEATVALWLAGSWCCNPGSNGTSVPHSERPVWKRHQISMYPTLSPIPDGWTQMSVASGYKQNDTDTGTGLRAGAPQRRFA
ncbi:hypothetical protein [Polaromonas sp. LjRoot131]|uniref:hypothetical protein n=1 Tax=Polaromonas sp. LjRoot131 TaxID=3342262 RepID=UPI003ECDFB47